MHASLDGILRFVRRSSLILGSLLGGGILVAVTWLVANRPAEVADAEPISLARPAPGEVRPDHLPDGTPVWVIGHGDGSADIILGFDTHTPLGLGKMLWWCETARGLDNPHHGSKWDEYGVKISGPAPTGLPSFDVEVDGHRLMIGALRSAPPTTRRASGPPEDQRAWCMGADAAVSYHEFDGWRVWDSPARAVAEAPDGWILLEGELVAEPGERRVHLCALANCGDRALAANVEMPPAELEFNPLGAGRFIARVQDGQLIDVSRVIRLDDGGE